MSIEDAQTLPCDHVPNAEGFIFTSRQGDLAIRCQTDAKDRLFMSMECMQALPCDQVPNANGKIFAIAITSSRDSESTIRRQADT